MKNTKVYLMSTENVKDPRTFALWKEFLPKEHWEKTVRPLKEEDRKTELAAWFLLYQALREWGISEEKINADGAYYYGEHGKPQIVNFPKKFNLSHSGDYVVCAVGDGEVGADIQKWVPYKERTAERFFAPTEWKLLQELPASQRTELFYRLWSRKEAYGKYTGQGISSAVGEDFSDEQNWQEKQICFRERVLEDSYSLAVCYGTAEA